MEQMTPLGHIVLDSGTKEIYPMNDFFTNFTYENPENWETLRLIINMVYEAYRRENPNATAIAPIEGDILVATQYKFYVKPRKTKRQDIKLMELTNKKPTFLEFQNRASTIPPVPTQAIDYFVLGISRSENKMANQVWLLAQDVPAVLHGETFTHYVMTDEITGKTYPGTSGILFVSLSMLSKENNPAGELASFLTGKLKDPKSKDVQTIAKTIKASFDAFRADKEVKRTMTVAEKYKNEGIVEGTTEGMVLAIDQIQELVNSGLSLAEALNRIRSVAASAETARVTTSILTT